MIKPVQNYHQEELLLLLRRQASLLTSGDTSLRLETAQQLLHSITFTLSFAVRPTLAEQLEAGRRVLARELALAAARYQRLVAQPPEITNGTYDTTVAGIAQFFACYDRYFAAHEVPCEIDYPLLAACWELEGVQFINAYLQRLQWENELCHCFSPTTRQRIYAAYMPAGAADHINLAEPLFMGALKALMHGENPSEPGEKVLLKGAHPEKPLKSYASELCGLFHMSGKRYFEEVAESWQALL